MEIGATYLVNERCKSALARVDSRKSRADNFPIEEIELMLKEMKCRSDVILSLSPSSHRLKKSAWEEVTAIMGIYFPKRSSEQVKKKWENLLTKTRRKVRQSLVNTSSWSKLNDLVWKFLLENRETKYLFGPGRFSRADELSNLLGVSLTAESRLSPNAPTESWSVCSPIPHVVTMDSDLPVLVHNRDLVDSKEENLSVSGTDNSTANNASYLYPSSTVPPFEHFSSSVQEEMLSQWRDEHNLRMQILALEREASSARLRLLKMKLERTENG